MTDKAKQAAFELIYAHELHEEDVVHLIDAIEEGNEAAIEDLLREYTQAETASTTETE
jgi:hypothetical protein